MHAFVDQMNFANIPFVDALRAFLQAFRLPGEAQKIDRFMEKFAQRYIEGNPQNPFASAGKLFQTVHVLELTLLSIVEAAYVLSYSIILLNTDAHSPQVKKRMTREDFIKNNRKINDGGDFPEDFMTSIYEEITTNEIRMKDEIDAALPVQSQGPGIASAIANVGRDLQKEAYVMQSLGIANKTEVRIVNYV